MKTALVIAPHPDDAELAMGGTIVKMIAAFWDIVIADLTDGEPISIQTEIGRFETKLRVVANMAAGVLIIPRHRKLAWQIFKAGASIGRDQINKVTT